MRKSYFTIVFSVCLLVLNACEKEFSGTYVETPDIYLESVDREWTVTNEELLDMLCGYFPGTDAFKPLIGTVLNRDIHFVAISYRTTDTKGEPCIASGLIAYPVLQNSGHYARIVSIQHGTCNICDAPSTTRIPVEILPAAIGYLGEMAGERYFICVMADYLGYGVSRTDDLQHPYLHNSTTGKTCADMLCAAGEYISKKRLHVGSAGRTGRNIDLVGYSQGGAATISTLQELLSRKGWESKINEVWAGAGPYDMTCFLNYAMENDYFGSTEYIAYAMRGIINAEGLDVSYSNIFNPGLDSTMLETMFSTKQVSEWHSVLGSRISNMLHPDFYKPDFGNNSDIVALMDAFKKNSVSNTSAPSDDILSRIRLFHCPDDGTVPYSCSDSLQTKWNLPPVTGLSGTSHVGAALEFMGRYCKADEVLEKIKDIL